MNRSKGMLLLSVGSCVALTAAALTGCSANESTDDEEVTTGKLGQRSTVETVSTEARDIFETIQLEGAVEEVPPIPVTLERQGRFIPAKGIKKGQNVSEGKVLGKVVSCTRQEVQREQAEQQAREQREQAEQQAREQREQAEQQAREQREQAEQNSTHSEKTPDGPPAETPPAPEHGESGTVDAFAPPTTHGAHTHVVHASRIPVQSSDAKSPAAANDPNIVTEDCPRWSHKKVITAPASGVVGDIAETVGLANDIATTITTGHFRGRLSAADPAVLYHFTSPVKTGRGIIVGGPVGFPANFLTTEYTRDGGQAAILCDIPPDIKVFAGLTMKVVFNVATHDNVASLPLSAVRGRESQGQVVLVGEQGNTEIREVELGAKDKEFIEVKGLTMQDKVLLFPLESDFTPR